MDDFREILRRELRQRRERNPRYTQAAFARQLGLSSGRLSEILRGKQGLSPDRAARVAERLSFPSAERHAFVDLVRASHARSEGERMEASARLATGTAGDRGQRVRLDWPCHAILEILPDLPAGSPTAELARRLGVTRDEVLDALTVLRREGLLGEGARPATEGRGEGPPAGPPKRKVHARLLAKARRALEAEGREDVEFEAIVLRAPANRLPELKRGLRDLLARLAAEAAGPDPDGEVFCIAAQLFPLTRK